jgi:hypothetical protein
MLYHSTNVENKVGSSGKGYQTATLTDVNGQVFERVSSFGDFQEGKQLDGQIIQNGTYLNFKAQAQVQTGGKAGAVAKQVEQAQERTAQHVAVAQTVKNDAIQHAGSITNATHLVVAMLEANYFPVKSEEAIKTKVREYVVWYQNLYKYPEEINPSSSEQPPF